MTITLSNIMWAAGLRIHADNAVMHAPCLPSCPQNYWCYWESLEQQRRNHAALLSQLEERQRQAKQEHHAAVRAKAEADTVRWPRKVEIRTRLARLEAQLRAIRTAEAGGEQQDRVAPARGSSEARGRQRAEGPDSVGGVDARPGKRRSMGIGSVGQGSPAPAGAASPGAQPTRPGGSHTPSRRSSAHNDGPGGTGSPPGGSGAGVSRNPRHPGATSASGGVQEGNVEDLGRPSKRPKG